MVVIDLQIARAVAAMKADPSRNWTVAALAKIACLSRAAFARRFKKAMRVPPLRWLTEHRLKIAQTRPRGRRARDRLRVGVRVREDVQANVRYRTREVSPHGAPCRSVSRRSVTQRDAG
jgi:AraC-like DNA-binding protein